MKTKQMTTGFFKAFAFIVVMGFTGVSCDDASTKTDNSVVVPSDPANENNNPTSAGTSNEKMVGEVISTTVDLTRTVIKTLKVNDSIRVANREKMYAYQIGLPIGDKDEVFEEYGKLENTESVYVLEKSRKEFYILKYEGKTKEELTNGLEEYKKSISSDLSGGAKVINVMDLCSKRDKLMKGENLTKRKETTEIPCLICK